MPAEKGAACQAGAVDFAGMQRSAKKAGLRVRLVKPSLEELAGCPLAIVSTGPDRDHTIVLQDPFA